MKAKWMILLLLAGAWVLWDNMDKKAGWQPVSEHETLMECDTARLKRKHIGLR